MKVTVCELDDDPERFAHEWTQLVAHVKNESSRLVLLPEMPFYPFFPMQKTFSPLTWHEAITAHNRWQERLTELAPAAVLSARPVDVGNRRFNEGFVWDQDRGYRSAHTKYYLPDEEGAWEASWYQRGEGSFDLVQSGGASLGFLICSELWFMERARAYGQEGAHLLVTPRATQQATVDKWLVGGRASAVISGAYSLSSNRVSQTRQPTGFGGQGWIIGPDGDVLGVTSRDRPFLTLDLDLTQAERAKTTYPRCLPD